MFHTAALVDLIRSRLGELRRRARSDAGYTTETIVVTALLSLLAITVVGIIVAKVTSKANSVDLG
ncbi:hypothetical protein [Streptomyces sp. NPDC050560]|uniref:hypothetical protein n=1 Tax=Streptomyces sp. NPDC050560 TaxID=3365630 RepID=UPI00379D6C5A